MPERHVLVSTKVGPFTAHVYLARRAKDQTEDEDDLRYAADLLEAIADSVAKEGGGFWLRMVISTELDAEARRVALAILTGMKAVPAAAGAIEQMLGALKRFQRRAKHLFVAGWLMKDGDPLSEKLMELH